VFIRRSVPEPAPTIRGLRQQVLTIEPAALGLVPTGDRPNVWGVLMELGQRDALVTLVALGDGTTSLYLGTGGGVIGAGEHESVRKVAAAFLLETERSLDHLAPTTDSAMPKVGQVRFIARTFSGLRAAAAPERTLGEGRHPLAGLFFAGHRVIAAIRERTEARAAG
jgi:hypothetical protein